MQTGLKLATLGLVVSLITLIWLGQGHRRLAAENLRLERRNAELRSELKLATRQAARVAQDVVTLDTRLGATKTALTERNQREAALLAEITALREQPKPAEPGASPPDQQRRIDELEGQLATLLARALAEPLAAEPAQSPPLKIVRLGPDDAFVILDGGASRDLRVGQILPIGRGTSEVARVQISDVRPRLAVAQVLPATLKGKLQTGDIVLSLP